MSFVHGIDLDTPQAKDARLDFNRNRDLDDPGPNFEELSRHELVALISPAPLVAKNGTPIAELYPETEPGDQRS